MSNTTGAIENVEISRLIKRSSIPLFSHVSEGMFRESEIEEFVWGWNKFEKKFSEIVSGVWSKKSFYMALRAYPEAKKVYKVSGAIGFDKYSILNENKIESRGYSKIIGYAGFDFNNIRSKKEYFIKSKGEEFYDDIMNKAQLINDILMNLVDNNKDTLFLLKAHPGDGILEPVEFNGLKFFENVKVVERNVGIVQVIASCDIWLSYNSSTNLEAWLLNKPTIAFNTDEKTFSSDVLYGAVCENDVNKIQGHIDELYNDNKIDDFDAKKELRNKLISDYIGFSDGMNHVRFMSFLKEYIDAIEENRMKRNNWDVPIKIRVRGCIRHCLFLIAKKYSKFSFLNRWRQPYSIFKEDEIVLKKKSLYKDFDKFYSDNEDNIDYLYKNWKNNWRDELGIRE